MAFFFSRAHLIKVPLIVTDEVQYRLLAENLYRYGRFLLRGHFPTTIAPLYSVVLALFEYLPSLASFSRFYQLVNAFLFASGLFPLYFLWRRWFFPTPGALALALLCLLLPHSFYVATCMSENLYFPLVLFFVLGVFFFLEEPTFFRALGTGVLGGLLLLTKSSAAFVVFSFALFALGLGFRHPRYLRPTLLVLLVCFFLYFPWLLGKSLSLGPSTHSTLGAYSENWKTVSEQLLSRRSLRFLFVYTADFVFATGFVSILPVFFYFFTRSDPRRTQVWFLFFLSWVLICVAAIFSGLNTGWLRERHMFVIFPFYVGLFFYVLSRLEERDWQLLWPWTLAFLLFFSILLELYDFNIAAPTIESPWVNLMDLYLGLRIPKKEIYAHISLYLLPFVLFVLFLLYRRNPFLLAIWFLFFFLFPSYVTFSTIKQWDQRIFHSPVTEAINWLKKEIGLRKRLFVTGRHAYFEPAPLQKQLDPLFVEWNESLLLKNLFVYRLEMAGLYDVRMISTRSALKKLAEQAKGEPLLTTVDLSGFNFQAALGPLRLYRIAPHPVKIKYQAFIEPLWFFTQVGNRQSLFGKQKIEASRPGWAVFGPYWTLPSGRYRVIFLLSCAPKTRLSLDVYAHSLGTLAKKKLSCYEEKRPVLVFNVRQRARYEFRVFLEKGKITFEGVQLFLEERL